MADGINMNEKELIESGLLDAYALGLCNPSERSLVESFLSSSGSIREEYLSIQQNMEKLAQSRSVKVSAHVKDKLFTRIQHLENEFGSKLIDMKTKSIGMVWMGRMAAAILILITSSLAYYNWNQYNNARSINKDLHDEIEALEKESAGNIAQMESMQETLKIVTNPSARKIFLNGNEKAGELSIIAYRNNTDGESYLHIDKIPDPPSGKCFQLWGDVNGEMISLGVIPQKPGDFFKINHLTEATSLNITIENEGGSEHPTVTDLVASAST